MGGCDRDGERQRAGLDGYSSAGGGGRGGRVDGRCHRTDGLDPLMLACADFKHAPSNASKSVDGRCHWTCCWWVTSCEDKVLKSSQETPTKALLGGRCDRPRKAKTALDVGGRCDRSRCSWMTHLPTCRQDHAQL